MTFDLIELQRTAVHEAGHAMMARRLRLEVSDVTIVKAGSRLGKCRWVGMANWRMKYAVAVAGPWAGQQWFDEDTADLTDWTRAEEIVNEALEAGELPDDVAEITRQVQELEADTQLILEGLRPQIEHLAKELLIRQTMTGDEIEELFNTSPPIVATASPATVISPDTSASNAAPEKEIIPCPETAAARILR